MGRGRISKRKEISRRHDVRTFTTHVSLRWEIPTSLSFNVQRSTRGNVGSGPQVIVPMRLPRAAALQGVQGHVAVRERGWRRYWCSVLSTQLADTHYTVTTLALQQKFLRRDTLPLSRLASVFTLPTSRVSPIHRRRIAIPTHSHSHQGCFHLLSAG